MPARSRAESSPIILVDDDAEQRSRHQRALERHGFGPILGLAQLHAGQFARHPLALVLITVLPGSAAASMLLARLHAEHPHLTLIAVGVGRDEAIAEYRMAGISEVVLRPLSDDALVAAVQRQCMISQQWRTEPAAFATPKSVSPGQYPTIVSLVASAPDAVFGTAPLLLVGEDGCEGLQLAEDIHRRSGRSGRFGELPAAQTDVKHLRGQLADCTHGTLYITELAALSAAAQEALCRLLDGQGPRFQRRARLIIGHEPSLSLGTVRTDLQRLVSRQSIALPALRDIRSAIPQLIEALLGELAFRHHWRIPVVPLALVPLVERYSFPGNLRELRNLVISAIQDSRGEEFSLAPFAAAVASAHSPQSGLETSTLLRTIDRLPTLRDMQRLLIDEALRRTRNHQSEAAGLLGISRQALHKRLRTRDQDVSLPDESGFDGDLAGHSWL